MRLKGTEPKRNTNDNANANKAQLGQCSLLMLMLHGSVLRTLYAMRLVPII